MKTVLLLASATVIILALPSCHTMQGFGEDISALGQSISSASGAVEHSGGGAGQ